MLNDRALRYFIAAAEVLHVGRAAEALGIAQPALSQQIKILESRLRVRLFQRGHRRIALTEAGKVFLEDAKRLLAHADQAVLRAREAEDGEAGELCVGYSGSVVFEPRVQHLLQTFRSKYPRVILTLVELDPQQQLDAMEHERLDIAFLRAPITSVPVGVSQMEFVVSPLVIALPTNHALAGAESVVPQDLRDDTFIGFLDTPGVGLRQSLHLFGERAGFAPRIGMNAGTVMSVLGLVGAGLGVALVPDMPFPIASPSVTLSPLRDPSATTTVLLLTRTVIASKAARRFVALGRQVEDAPLAR